MKIPTAAAALLTLLTASPAFALPPATVSVKPGVVVRPKAAPVHGAPKISPRPSYGDSFSVQPRRITNLVPQTLVRGDREFGGNGPHVSSTVELRISSDRRSIVADIRFRAVETKGDRSTTDQRWQRTIYRAPAGRTIAKIPRDNRSAVSFLSKKAGFQLIAPGEDTAAFFRQLDEWATAIMDAHMRLATLGAGDPAFRSAQKLINDFNAGARDAMVHGNHVHNVVPSSGPVALMSIVGDTGGDDISDDANGKDDTRIEAITFKEIKVQLNPR